jgi:hypothetical protein
MLKYRKLELLIHMISYYGIRGGSMYRDAGAAPALFFVFCFYKSYIYFLNVTSPIAQPSSLKTQLGSPPN